MDKTVTVPTLHQPLHSKVSNYLNDQRRKEQYSDIIFELEDNQEDEAKLYGHFCVVAAQSRFIKILGGSLHFSISNPLKVTVKSFKCLHCLETMMDFFYEDVIAVAKDHEEHFKQLAKILGVDELISLYQMEMDSNGTEESYREAEISTECGVLNPNENIEKDDVINSGKDCIFSEKPTYFKLKNPRAPSSSSKINYCIGCDFKCYRVSDMISHMGSCEASHLTCSLCEFGFVNWREYDLHLRNHSQDLRKPFFCLECNVRFMTRGALILHHPKHSAQTPYICEHCGKGFKWKQGLTSHMLVHRKEKQMLCDVCGYSTTHMKALKSHKLKHTGEFFKCTYSGCNHRANRKENLKLHMDTHKQERPFVCEVCGCKFSQSKNLKRHALKHETQVDVLKKYKCQLCSFGSHRSDKVKEHVQRVHTEKVVQLELPEIVENSFEINVTDGFDLPLILCQTTNNEEQKNVSNPLIVSKASKTKSVSRQYAKKIGNITSNARRLHPLAPKII